MALSSVTIYSETSSSTRIEIGTLYFNSVNKLWYVDAGGTRPISNIYDWIPEKECYRLNFVGFSTSIPLTDADGNITATSRAGSSAYCYWTKISRKVDCSSSTS